MRHCRRPLPALGPLRILQRPAGRARPGRPADHVPNHELQGHRRPLPAGDDLAARAQLPQLHLRQRQSLRTIEGRPLLEMHPDDAAARGIADNSTVRVFNDRGSYECHAEVSTRARPGVVNGPGHLVAQAGAEQHQRERGDQPGPHGPGPCTDVLRLFGGGADVPRGCRGRRLLRKSPPDIHHREFIDLAIQR